MMTVPGRQVALYPIRGGRLATFFLHKDRRRLAGLTRAGAAKELRRVYGDLDWVVPAVLTRCDPAHLYFDAVSQIVMPRWSTGRVTLVGDACQCVSLLAGQGASLAIAGADALATELTGPGCDVEAALARYERRMKPRVDRSQEAGRSMARWFAPDSRVRLVVRDLVMRMAGSPLVAPLLKRVLAVGPSSA
jgi:2-polyprenyl-6-methoxyphenol hydroxylase-like FAD-dependent oxidoreductase